ncbi:MAG TPA: hypothetical protein VIX73_33235, partial [Kofleriaceae bacterium]
MRAPQQLDHGRIDLDAEDARMAVLQRGQDVAPAADADHARRAARPQAVRRRHAVVAEERQRRGVAIGVDRRPGLAVDADDARRIRAARLEPRRRRPQDRPPHLVERRGIDVRQRIPDLDDGRLGLSKRIAFRFADLQAGEGEEQRGGDDDAGAHAHRAGRGQPR